MLVKMASPPAYPAYRQAGGRQATPPPKREGLINLLAKSPSLLGEGDLGGEAEIRQEKTKELYSSSTRVSPGSTKDFFNSPNNNTNKTTASGKLLNIIIFKNGKINS